MRLKSIFIFLLFFTAGLLQLEFLYAQAFDINSFFNGPQYGFYSGDSNNYLLNESATQALLEQNLQTSFRLPTGSFYNMKNKITYTGNRQFLQGLHNQVPAYDTMFKECSIDFTYGGISSNTYSFFIQSLGDTNTAFLMMPGSGYHQSFYIAEGNTQNYQNENCIIKDLLRSRGDVYVYIRPNEEFRSIWIYQNQAGIFPKLDYDVLDPYTKLHGIDWQDNIFSEINVWTQFLKSKYKRVVLLGLSVGGWPVLFSSLQTKPDACVVASGFSAASYQNFPVQNNENTILDGVLGVYTKDSLKKVVRSSNTEYLFTYGAMEGGGNLYEYYNHALEDTLQTPSTVSNVHFAYHSWGHVYPCASLDTFLTRVLNKPKVTLLPQQNLCNIDSLQVDLIFTGSSPHTFDLYRDTAFVASYICSADSMRITLYDAGEYTLQHIYDGNNIPGYNSESIHFIKETVNMQVVTQQFVCDSNKTAVQLHFSGVSPWILNYAMNGVVHNDTLINPNKTYFLPHGSLIWQYVSNLDGCLKVINQMQTLADSVVQVSMSAPVYSCDSQKVHLHFDFQGRSPWRLNYLLNGVAQFHYFTSTSSDWYVGNGDYFFSQVIDSNACVATVNQYEHFQYYPIGAQWPLSLPYNCDSNKTLIHLSLQGNTPWIIHYTLNSFPQTFTAPDSSFNFLAGDGEYHLLNLTDATGCSYPLNQAYLIANHPFAAQVSSSAYLCDSDKTRLHFQLTGTAPFTVSYIQNSILQTYNSMTSVFDLYWPNGHYNLLSIHDSNSCQLSLGTSFNFNYHPILVTHSAPIYQCSTNEHQFLFHFEGNLPFTLSYTKDGQPDQLTSWQSDTLISLQNGDYHFGDVTDVTSCLFHLNEDYQFHTTILSAQVTMPYYDCSSQQTWLHMNFTGNAPYTIHYAFNAQPQQWITAGNSFDQALSNGSYYLTDVTDAQNCSVTLSQLYPVNESPLTVTHSVPVYHCTLHKTQVLYHFSGKSPFQLHYTFNGATQIITMQADTLLRFVNGIYFFDEVSDANGCQYNLNETDTFSFTPLTLNLATPVYSCDSNKMNMQVSLTGQSPCTFYYFKDLQPQQWTSNQSPFNMYMDNGNYYFYKVSDQTGCQLDTSVFYAFSHQALGLNIWQQAYLCDSQKIRWNYSLTGDGPWQLIYKNNVSGLQQLITTNTASGSILIPFGSYSLLSVADQNCSTILNQDISNTYTPLLSTMGTPWISCDSARYTLVIHTSGGAKPYLYSYYLNGVPHVVSSYADSIQLYLPNGNYFFSMVTDSLGCQVVYNQNFLCQYNDFQFNGFSTHYLCAQDSTQITLDITHQQAVWVVYTQNGLTSDTLEIQSQNWMNKANGLYYFSMIYDSIGCTKMINQSCTVDNHPVSLSGLSLVRDCQTKQYFYQGTLGGLSPWTLYYNFNNVPVTQQFAATTLHWPVTTGEYYLAHLKDSNQCDLLIGRSDTLHPFLATTPVLQLNAGMFSVTPVGYYYYWYRNGVLIDSGTTVTRPHLQDGQYQVMLKDAAGCLLASNFLTAGYPASVHEQNLESGLQVYPNPFSDILYIHTTDDFGAAMYYMLADMQGRVVQEGQWTAADIQWSLSHLSSGTYQLLIRYASDGSCHVLRIYRE